MGKYKFYLNGETPPVTKDDEVAVPLNSGEWDRHELLTEIIIQLKRLLLK